jgi:hypothetical protein
MVAVLSEKVFEEVLIAPLLSPPQDALASGGALFPFLSTICAALAVRAKHIYHEDDIYVCLVDHSLNHLQRVVAG